MNGDRVMPDRHSGGVQTLLTSGLDGAFRMGLGNGKGFGRGLNTWISFSARRWLSFRDLPLALIRVLFRNRTRYGMVMPRAGAVNPETRNSDRRSAFPHVAVLDLIRQVDVCCIDATIGKEKPAGLRRRVVLSCCHAAR
jgi:hypothetical protein